MYVYFYEVKKMQQKYDKFSQMVLWPEKHSFSFLFIENGREKYNADLPRACFIYFFCILQICLKIDSLETGIYLEHL